MSDLHITSVYPEFLVAFAISSQPSSRSLEATLDLLSSARRPLANTTVIYMAYHTMPRKVHPNIDLVAPPKAGAPPRILQSHTTEASL